MTSHNPPTEADTFNYAAHLFDSNAGRGGKTAYIDDRGSLSYADLDERSRRMAAAMPSAATEIR